jgi:NADPH-dependent ferric siderophore reductase
MTTTPPIRRVTRVRHEVRRREVVVSQTERLGPNIIGITFAGDDLAGFQSDGFDDHVKFSFVASTGERISRDFTPRQFDATENTLTIEFVLHDVGEANEWARRAAAGTSATIGGPKSSMVIPTDYAWHVLAGDSVALPAIARRLEELPADTRAIVLLRLDDEADRRDLSSAAPVTLQWLDPADDLADAIAKVELPAGEGFVWCAGEASEMARVRDALLNGRGHPREAMRVAAYWKRDQGNFHETLESGVAAN